MADSIQDAVPTVLETLWHLENELRSAAQNGVILRGDEARKHLQQARFHLDQLLALSKNGSTDSQAHSPASTVTINSNDNQSRGG